MSEANNISEVLANAFVTAADGFPAGLELDHARYLPELADIDMPEEQKVVLLETLWPIMRSFVELGFASDIHSNTCEQLTGTFNAVAGPTLDGVNYAEVSSPSVSAVSGVRGGKGLRND